MHKSFRSAALVLMIGLAAKWTLGQKQILHFRTRFTQETGAVHRAPKMPKLGEAEFDEIAMDIDEGKLTDGLAVLKEYRDEIQSCEKDPRRQEPRCRKIQKALSNWRFHCGNRCGA